MSNVFRRKEILRETQLEILQNYSLNTYFKREKIMSLLILFTRISVWERQMYANFFFLRRKNFFRFFLLLRRYCLTRAQFQEVADDKGLAAENVAHDAAWSRLKSHETGVIPIVFNLCNFYRVGSFIWNETRVKIMLKAIILFMLFNNLRIDLHSSFLNFEMIKFLDFSVLINNTIYCQEPLLLYCLSHQLRY